MISQVFSMFRSALLQEQIEDETPANVRPRPPTMGEDLLVLTSSVFKGVGENPHPLKRPVLVDLLSDLLCRSVVGRQPDGIDSDPAEGVADDVAEDGQLTPGVVGFPTLDPRTKHMVGHAAEIL